MKHTKQELKNLTLPKFWFWAYSEKKLHYFQKYNWITKPLNESYKLVLCNDEDIDNGNLLYFIENGLTR